ncbi:MAG: hypothetical protein OXG23_01680 [Chloroflexi bacterium]|nr:hypothetical protein [Chloroflexota bacterium]
MSRYEQEWPHRKAVMEAIMFVLRDGKPRKASDILHSLPYEDGIKVSKKLVNSILSSEAKRYVSRDQRNFTYRIREADASQTAYPPWDLVRSTILQLLQYHGPLSVDDLKEELESDGMPAPKWMIKVIASSGDFRVSASPTDENQVAVSNVKGEKHLHHRWHEPGETASRQREIDKLIDSIPF